MKNSFLLRLLSAGIVTVGPNPRKYFPTSFLILSPSVLQWVVFHGEVAGFIFPAQLLGLQTEAKRWPSKQFTNTSHFAGQQQFPLVCHSCYKSPTTSRLESAFSAWHCIALIPLDHNRAQGAPKDPKSQSLNFLSQPPRGKPLTSWHLYCAVATVAWRSFASGKISEKIAEYL